MCDVWCNCDVVAVMEGGILHFVCRDLAAKADGKSDPFATLLFGKEQFNTQVRTLMCVYIV